MLYKLIGLFLLSPFFALITAVIIATYQELYKNKPQHIAVADAVIRWSNLTIRLWALEIFAAGIYFLFK